MESFKSVEGSSKVSIETIVENIRNSRDHQLNELLKETPLMAFLEEHYGIIAINKVKLEFIRRDLKELQNSSLDLAHYSSLIKLMKGANTITVDVNHPVFLLDLKSLFKKYNF